jgi:outer membrane protein TolC
MDIHELTMAQPGKRSCNTAVAAALILAVLGGCSVYHPLPLDTSPKLASSLNTLCTVADASALPIPKAWKRQSIDVGDGLNETETVVLAVLNSPELEAARTQIAEAKASLYAAGLLPDPRFDMSFDFPTSKDPTLTTGENYGLGIDLQQILTRNARRDVATEAAAATYLHVLWQEWQVIQKARMLWRRALIQQRQIDVLQDQSRQAKTTWEEMHQALMLGNANLDQEGLALAPMMDAQAAVKEAKRQLNATMHEMHLLLGVDPGVPLVLAGAKDIATLVRPPMEGDALQMLLNRIGKRRPDLLALQAGYRSQENKVREQILKQFPSFSIGANKLRDTSGVWTLGPFINLDLPLFNANRGNIAMARATRMRLHEEFHYQLTSAYVQASKIAMDQRLAFKEWQGLSARMPELEKTEERMEQALASGEIDMLTFTTLRTAYFSQQAKMLNLEQALLEQSVALETLTGTLPSMSH